MTLREVLQIEIWSKETSRTILRRIWKVTRPVAVASGILILLLGAGYAVECYWLTSGEREAGKAALAKIEELEQLETNSSDGFDAMNRQAKASVAIAEQKAWTLRDKRAVGLLHLYRWELETDHENRVREVESRAFVAKKHLTWPSHQHFESQIRESQIQIYRLMSSVLHKELD